MREKKKETMNGKKLFIEAANTIFPQMFLCCYINSPLYARDHRRGVMARNKECCLSDGEPKRSSRVRQSVEHLRDNKINHIASREVSDLKHFNQALRMSGK